jgi:hypothetical protein
MMNMVGGKQKMLGACLHQLVETYPVKKLLIPYGRE